MKKIFLDCGGHCGESVKKFLPLYPDYDFYTFEANKDLSPIIVAEVVAAGRNIFYYPGAIWTHDGFLEFFIGHDQGSTALSGKVEYFEGVQQVDYETPIKVPCIDLSSWILRNISEEDELVIKMDVEGAEYKVLPKMLAEGALKRVRLLYCEWHKDRFPEISQDFHDNLVRDVGNATKLEFWA